MGATITTEPALPDPAPVPEAGALPLLRLTAEQFEAMAEAGVFSYPNDRVVLREGLLCRMGPQDVPHMTAKVEVFTALLDALRDLGSKLRVGSEGSVRASDYNVPQPDVIVWDPVRIRGPVPRERVRLAVEVSDSTLSDDLGYKRALYAAAGIPEYWIVDLRGRAVHQNWAPADGAYSRSGVVPFGGTVASVAVPGLVIGTAALLEQDTAE